MTTNRYPVLVWRDHAGGFTAALIGDFMNSAAYGRTEDDALDELKELLRWRMEQSAYLGEPDFSEPNYFEVKVEIRPEYKRERERDKRPIPAPDSVWLRVPCVSGLDSGGMKTCCLPHLGFSFNYQETESLKPLVAHYVKDELRALHPNELFLKLPPQGCELREVAVRAATNRTPKIAAINRPELKLLFTVGDPLPRATAYARESIVEVVAQKLAREKANILLVGDAGVGKSTILADAARRIARRKSADDEDSRDLNSYRFWRTSGGRLIAGMAYLGEWEERLEQIIEKINAIEGVFCIENLLELVQVGGQGAGDSVAAFLLPYLRRGELRLAAEATPLELEACRRLLPGLLDVFQVVQVPAFEEAQALDVLTKIAASAASGRRMEFDPAVPRLTQRLFARFQTSASFPGDAARFIRQLFDRKRREPIGAPDVVAQFTRQTGLPEIFLRDDLPLHLADVRENLQAKIIGQPAATELAARVIVTIKAGLADPQRPFGVLLFTGPTGVGKTALANAVANFCFGGGDEKTRLIRLDMSEYRGWGAAHRLLFAAENRAAGWIERVRAQPFCVVLFDEIEKADPEVFDVLLGLLDEGRLTDPFGRVTNFRSAIVIMTSNLGSTARGAAGFAAESGPAFQDEVARFFRPEFFNRLDAVVEFKPLTIEHVEQITRKELAELAAREGFAADGIELRWDNEVISHLARAGYDQRLGARPLQRAIERLLATPLARWKVSNPARKNLVLRLSLDSSPAIKVTEIPR